MRLGCSVSSVWNASATRSGAWFGNMMPPDPTRMRDVADATCSIRISGTELAMLGHAVVRRTSSARTPAARRDAPGRPIPASPRVRGSIADRNEIEDRKCNGVGSHLMRTVRYETLRSDCPHQMTPDPI